MRLGLLAPFGPEASARQRAVLGRRVVASFYDFACDMGRNRHLDIQQLAALVDHVEGAEHFDVAASRGRGVVVVTAHLGSFETAVAALRFRTGPIHLVFKRDDLAVFERMRTEQRRKLGVSEAPVDEGWPMWLRLRNALLKGEVALIQGDRLLPGQRGEVVPFLGGHLELPTGPAKLALASGSPLLPVFALKDASSRIRLVIDEPIFVQPDSGVAQLPEVMRLLAKAIERQVARHPEQWLMLHPAWCEDQRPGTMAPSSP
jgi:KDO2-lipid IV(A) lauroyltransferase